MKFKPSSNPVRLNLSGYKRLAVTCHTAFSRNRYDTKAVAAARCRFREAVECVASTHKVSVAKIVHALCTGSNIKMAPKDLSTHELRSALDLVIG